jgi:beta-lactam-binding protein with PASTA domain
MRRMVLAVFLVFAVGCTVSTSTNGPSYDLTGSTQPPPAVDTPDVTGMTVTDAKTAISDVGLTPSLTKEPSNVSAGTVLAQDPAAGTSVDVGTTVSITVAVPQPSA